MLVRKACTLADELRLCFLPEIHLRDQRQAGRANGEGAEGGRPPPSEQLNRQQPQPTFEEEIARQEQAARNQEKAVTGLEIAQGAIEITLGAVRIAANGATADFIHREDAIARSRASASSLAIGREAQGRAPEGRQKDAAEEAARRAVSGRFFKQANTLQNASGCRYAPKSFAGLSSLRTIHTRRGIQDI